MASPICALWVDDQPETFLILKHLTGLAPGLGSIEWKKAATSHEAQIILEEWLPHFIVLDLHLGPEDKGLDWLLKVRKGRFRNIPVVIMTSVSEIDSVKTALSMGAEDYILKPADPKTLAAKLLSIKTRLETRPSYAFKAKDTSAEYQVGLRVEGEILSLSETGVMIAGSLYADHQFDVIEPDSTVFTQAGIESPLRLTILNSIHDPRSNDGSTRKQICMWKGLKRADVGSIRKWILDHKLSRGNV